MKELLNQVVRDRVLHARWLNTFSYLEYVGFRKIVKSQGTEDMSAETLSHAVEEGRHALRLKRLAMKVGGSRFDNYADENLLCGRVAENYFQTLDQRCSEICRHSRMTYLYVTWLVEVRALEVYGYYHQAMQAVDEPPPLQGLLKEEEGHLQYVEAELAEVDPEFESRSLLLKKIERDLYHQYVVSLKSEVPHELHI